MKIEVLKCETPEEGPREDPKERIPLGTRGFELKNSSSESEF